MKQNDFERDRAQADTSARISVLVVDADVSQQAAILKPLSEAGYETLVAPDAKSARQALKDHDVDVILLDLSLPGVGGKVLCREFAETCEAGLFAVSAKADEDERIALLEMGADECLAKPLNPREVQARIRAFVRRRAPRRRVLPRRLGPWTLDATGRQLDHSDGTRVILTPSEGRVMRMFIDNPDLVFDREELLAISRMRQIGLGSDRSVDNLIKRLRRKIEENPVKTDAHRNRVGQGLYAQSLCTFSSLKRRGLHLYFCSLSRFQAFAQTQHIRWRKTEFLAKRSGEHQRVFKPKFIRSLAHRTALQRAFADPKQGLLQF